MELRQLELDALDLSLGRLRRLPEARVARMEASLQSKGQLSPVVVAHDADRWVLIDGFVRTLAARRLNLETLSVEIIRVTPGHVAAMIGVRFHFAFTVLPALDFASNAVSILVEP